MRDFKSFFEIDWIASIGYLYNPKYNEVWWFKGTDYKRAKDLVCSNPAEFWHRFGIDVITEGR